MIRHVPKRTVEECGNGAARTTPKRLEGGPWTTTYPMIASTALGDEMIAGATPRWMDQPNAAASKATTGSSKDTTIEGFMRRC